MPSGSTQQTVTAGRDVFTVRVACHGDVARNLDDLLHQRQRWHAGNLDRDARDGDLARHERDTAIRRHHRGGTGCRRSFDGSAGTIAVPILDALAGTPFANSTIPVTVTLSGTWTKGPGTANSQPAVPTGQIAGWPTPVSVNTTAGCAVFLGVDPDPGWTYSISINNGANTAGGAAGTELHRQQRGVLRQPCSYSEHRTLRRPDR